jgi:hypothetical protein
MAAPAFRPKAKPEIDYCLTCDTVPLIMIEFHEIPTYSADGEPHKQSARGVILHVRVNSVEAARRISRDGIHKSHEYLQS